MPHDRSGRATIIATRTKRAPVRPAIAAGARRALVGAGVAGVGTHLITYSFTDSHGCTNSASQNINVVALPVANAGNDTTLCIGQTGTIGADSISGYSYFWQPPAGLSSITESKPLANPSATTPYMLVVTTVANCSDTDFVTVFIDSCTNTGVGEMIPASGIRIYPNPFFGELNIEVQSVNLLNLEFILSDLPGRELIRKSFSGSSFRVENVFLPEGIYFYQVLEKGGRPLQSGKIISAGNFKLREF